MAKTIITHNIHSEVIEKRAPTDESVRLLREMESAAKKEVLKSIPLPSNHLSGVVHMIRDELGCSTKIAVLFRLNGKDHRVNIVLHDYSDTKDEARVEKCISEVSTYIASEILRETFNTEQIREIVRNTV